jgi:hypothetical protein
MVLAASLCLGLKIVSYGFVPAGDARRHVARVMTEKDYNQIVVLRSEYKTDHSPGWDWILRRVRGFTGWGEDALMSFSVAGMMLCLFVAGLPWLRRPEAWSAALLALLVALPNLMLRVSQGRPFLLSEAVLVCILFAWRRAPSARPAFAILVLTVIGFTLSVWVHGAWYLWLLVLGAFFLAGAWRQACWLAGCWVVGTIIGGLFSGQPLAFLYGSVFMAASVYAEHAPAWMLVGEFQPSDGEFFILAVLALVYIWRRRQNPSATDLFRQPIFWMIAIGWILGFKADRFWGDWGLPAAAVWLALQFEAAMLEAWPAAGCRRLLLCALLAAPLYLDATSDLNSRYTRNLQETFVDASDPSLKDWLPADGGIFYNSDMAFFYNTFYKNPQANWRYILAYEPALMPPEDLKTFRAIQRAPYDWDAYKPWLRKIRPQDRMEIPSAIPPQIPELEWHQATKSIWLGRLP